MARCYSSEQWGVKHINGFCILSRLRTFFVWQVWNLESRSIAGCLQWESNITAFSVISGSHFMYVIDKSLQFMKDHINQLRWCLKWNRILRINFVVCTLLQHAGMLVMSMVWCLWWSLRPKTKNFSSCHITFQQIL